MIAANKRYLKANLTQGVLGIQTNLINLYSSNLSAIATQAALIAGFSFAAVATDFTSTSLAGEVLSYFYYVCFTLCLTAAIFVLTQATVCVMFGPTMALKGSNDEAVKIAAMHMMNQQIYILKIAQVSITALFLGACLLSWGTYPIGIAAITTVVYIATYYMIITEGLAAYTLFIPTEDGAFVESAIDSDGEKVEVKRTATNFFKKLPTDETAKERQESARKEFVQKMTTMQEETRLKLKSYLFKRQPIEEGGLFVKYFAVLEKGRLDFYKQEKDFVNNANPVNSKPIKLWQFDLETDHRKYAKNVTSLGSTMKSAMIGNEDFSMMDLLNSEYDLQLASRNYKFGLLPKVSSELSASTVYEFVSYDEKNYKQWTATLGKVVNAYDAIAAMPDIEHTIRVGSADVEMVVQAANNEI